MFCGIVTNGFAVFIKIDGNFDIEGFLYVPPLPRPFAYPVAHHRSIFTSLRSTAYFGIILTVIIYCGWKFLKRDGKGAFKKPTEMDLFSGAEEAEEDEKWWQENYVPPSTKWGRFIDWLL